MVFIAFEGFDGVGKSTQANRLLSRFKRERPDTSVDMNIEPNPVHWNAVKDIFFDLAPPAKALLFSALHTDSMYNGIGSLLKKHDIVIGDRSIYSMLAYQGRDVVGTHQWLKEIVHYTQLPDIVILLTSPLTTIKDRLSSKKKDEFENIPDNKIEKIYDEYHYWLWREPLNPLGVHCSVEATGTKQEVEDTIWMIVSAWENRIRLRG
tara:strand:+ start:903 stop:1523 length:621 start_codon:yes stop_codon:yes gene_type:complete